MPGSTNKRDIALLDVDNTVMERQTLANYMESRGFKVHGVITPSDIFWHLDQELMESFLSHFKRPDNSLTKTLLEQDQYSAINFAIESQPGVAFALALNNPESMAGITAHSQAANSVLGLVKKANDEYLTEKGHMYDLFIKHKPEWVNRIIFVDDANDNISAVEKANEKYKCRLFAVLNRDKQNACELPASFYQESFASLIGNHRLRQLLASYCDAKQNNSRQSASFSWSAFFHKALSPAQEETAIAAVQKALDNEETDLLPHLATLRQGELGSTIRRFVKSGAANALCGKKISTVSELVKALHNQVNGQNSVVFEV
ncbi:TPA: hypothetical protein ACPSKE_002763 [Legionella feeleii]